MCAAVQPALVSAQGSAPCDSSQVHTASLPRVAARCRVCAGTILGGHVGTRRAQRLARGHVAAGGSQVQDPNLTVNARARGGSASQ